MDRSDSNVSFASERSLSSSLSLADIDPTSIDDIHYNCVIVLGLGHQIQRTKKKKNDASPDWLPPQQFKFLVSKKERTKGSGMMAVELCSVNQDGGGELCLAHSELQFNEIPEGRWLSVVLPLKSAAGGDSIIENWECKAHLRVAWVTRKQSALLRRDEIWENERYHVLHDWGSSKEADGSGHLQLDERSRWSTNDGVISSQIRDNVVPKLDEGAYGEEWVCVTTKGDEDGWNYAKDWDAANFDCVAFPGAKVRRRLWARNVHPHLTTNDTEKMR